MSEGMSDGQSSSVVLPLRLSDARRREVFFVSSATTRAVFATEGGVWFGVGGIARSWRELLRSAAASRGLASSPQRKKLHLSGENIWQV